MPSDNGKDNTVIVVVAVAAVAAAAYYLTRKTKTTTEAVTETVAPEIELQPDLQTGSVLYLQDVSQPSTTVTATEQPYPILTPTGSCSTCPNAGAGSITPNQIIPDTQVQPALTPLEPAFPTEVTSPTEITSQTVVGGDIPMGSRCEGTMLQTLVNGSWIDLWNSQTCGFVPPQGYPSEEFLASCSNFTKGGRPYQYYTCVGTDLLKCDGSNWQPFEQDSWRCGGSTGGGDVTCDNTMGMWCITDVTASNNPATVFATYRDRYYGGGIKTEGGSFATGIHYYSEGSDTREEQISNLKYYYSISHGAFAPGVYEKMLFIEASYSQSG